MDANVEKNKIYIGNLPFKTTEEDLRLKFEKFQVEDVIILKDKETNRSRGFGFITLYNPENVAVAIEECDGMNFEGRTVKVSRASTRGRGGGSTYQNTSDRVSYRTGNYSGYSSRGGVGGGYNMMGQYGSGASFGTGGGYNLGVGYSPSLGYSSADGDYSSGYSSTVGYGSGGYGTSGGYSSGGYGTSDGYSSGGAGYSYSNDGGWGGTGGSYYGRGYGRGPRRGGGRGGSGRGDL